MIFVRRLVDLRVANEPFSELAAVVGRLRADAEDGDVVFLISSVLIDKGRNLGPTPRSPLATVKKDNRGRGLLQRRWKLHGNVIDVFQNGFRKPRADIQYCHGFSFLKQKRNRLVFVCTIGPLARSGTSSAL
jgi:hypothetical protein